MENKTIYRQTLKKVNTTEFRAQRSVNNELLELDYTKSHVIELSHVMAEN